MKKAEDYCSVLEKQKLNKVLLSLWPRQGHEYEEFITLVFFFDLILNRSKWQIKNSFVS